MAEPIALARPSEAPPFEAQAPYPQQVFLGRTNYCNAKCFFCPRNISGGDHPAGKAHQAREGAEQRQILQHVERHWRAAASPGITPNP